MFEKTFVLSYRVIGTRSLDLDEETDKKQEDTSESENEPDNKKED